MYEGTLMSFDQRQLVLAKDREKGPIFMVERGENIKRIQFSSLPEGLLTRPTLVWELAWLTWPRSIHFDSELFAMDYSGGQLLGVDMTSGRSDGNWWTARWPGNAPTAG